MVSIIQILQEAAEPAQSSPHTQEKLKNLIVYMNRIQTAFGIEFIDELTAAISEHLLAETDDAYERGFLNAFQLWLEVFSKYSSYPQR